MHDVLTYLLSIIDAGEIDASSMISVVGNIRDIPNLDENNAALVQKIHHKAEEIIKEYKIR